MYSVTIYDGSNCDDPVAKKYHVLSDFNQDDDAVAKVEVKMVISGMPELHNRWIMVEFRNNGCGFRAHRIFRYMENRKLDCTPLRVIK